MPFVGKRDLKCLWVSSATRSCTHITVVPETSGYVTLTTGVWTVVNPEAASAAAFAWTASGGGSVKPCAARGEPACAFGHPTLRFLQRLRSGWKPTRVSSSASAAPTVPLRATWAVNDCANAAQGSSEVSGWEPNAIPVQARAGSDGRQFSF